MFPWCSTETLLIKETGRPATGVLMLSPESRTWPAAVTSTALRMEGEVGGIIRFSLNLNLNRASEDGETGYGSAHVEPRVHDPLP